MRWLALALFALPALLPVAASAQSTLNKCIDAQGQVTYSNLPCQGAREVKRVEIDPPPPLPTRQPAPAPVLAVPAPAPLPAPAPQPVPKPLPSPAPLPLQQAAPLAAPPTPAAPRAEIQRSGTPAAITTPRTCDALTDQLGRVLDQMDAGQRKGVTQQQMDGWKLDIQDLERKKKEAGCF